MSMHNIILLWKLFQVWEVIYYFSIGTCVRVYITVSKKTIVSSALICQNIIYFVMINFHWFPTWGPPTLRLSQPRTQGWPSLALVSDGEWLFRSLSIFSCISTKTCTHKTISSSENKLSDVFQDFHLMLPRTKRMWSYCTKSNTQLLKPLSSIVI